MRFSGSMEFLTDTKTPGSSNLGGEIWNH
jgi:hypothetical protein